MLRNRNIAFFIDVDNVDLTSENFESIIAQLEGMGQIYTGKVYGAKERKHKAIYDQAEVKGYKVERPMRMKRRGRRDFDSRIFVDVTDTVCRAPSIDAVCIITASCDLVYLYSYLHGKGIKVISSDENEEASGALVDEYVDLGRVYDIDLPAVKPAPKKVKRTATRPAVATATRSVARAMAKNAEAEEVVQKPVKDDKTDELLKEIERLKRVAEETQAEKEAKSKAAEEAKAKAEAEAKARAEEREKARREIEEAKAKVREEAEAKAREEERQKAQKEIEEARAKAREEAEAKARAEEREKAQREIEEIRKKAQQAAEKAKAEEEERQKAQAEIERLRNLAEQQADEPDSPSARYYMQHTDGKLLKKIEEINNGGSGDNDDELLATIKDLLDGLDD